MYSLFMRFGRLLTAGLCLLVCLSPGHVHASDLIPLSQYLQEASKVGINIIYSTEIVPGHLKIQINRDNAISVDSIEAVLAPLELRLEKIDNSYVVTRRALSEKLVPSAPADSKPAHPLDELVITSSRYRLFQHDSEISFLGQSGIRRRAALANDGLRVVNQLPGSANNGISVQPRVRGGKEDETLIVFDGIQLYNPFHLKNYYNVFSSLDSRIIDSIEFYTGAFPARYGDRLSAVMKIDTLKPEYGKKKREIGMGFYNASFLYSAASDHSSWLLDARRSVLNIPASVAENDFGTPAYSDIYIRYDRELSDGDHLSVNAFWYGDKLSINNSSKTEYSKGIYSNSYFWICLDQNWSEDFYSESYLSLTSFNQNRRGNINKPGLVTGSLRDYREFNINGLKQDFHYLFSEKSLLEFGWDYDALEGEYRFNVDTSIAPLFATISNYPRADIFSADTVKTGKRASAYLSAKNLWYTRFSTELGLRSDYQHYRDSESTNEVNPRVALLFDLSDSTSLRLGWGKFSQGDRIDELKISDQLDQFLKPQTSIHQVAGVTQRFTSGLSLRIEIYKKFGTDENLYVENLTNSLNLAPELQPDRRLVTPDQYVARGLEFSLDNARSNRTLQWWFNYTYAIVEDHIDGRKVRRSWDQTHNANLGFSEQFGQWQYTLSGSYHTGWPTTSISLDPASGTLLIGNRNALRLEHYMSWDVKFSREWKLQKGKTLRMEAGVTNFLNRKNQVGVEYGLTSGQLTHSDQTATPIAPFLDLYLNF